MERILEIQKFRNQLTYKGIAYGDKVQASIIGNPTTEAITQIVDDETELNNDIDNYSNHYFFFFWFRFSY